MPIEAVVAPAHVQVREARALFQAEHADEAVAVGRDRAVVDSLHAGHVVPANDRVRLDNARRRRGNRPVAPARESAPRASLSIGGAAVCLTVAVRGVGPRFDFQVTFHEVRLGLPGNNESVRRARRTTN